jgi:hypothetical protein
MEKRGVVNAPTKMVDNYIYQFLKPYERFGLVNACIHVLRYRYSLFYLPVELPNDKKRQRFYETIFPKQIIGCADAFDASPLTDLNSPVMEAISGRLLHCHSVQDKERYIYTLLIPFKELSDLLYPHLAFQKRLDRQIEQYPKKKLELIEQRTWSEIVGKQFLELLKAPCDRIEQIFVDFCNLKTKFANRLDALLLFHQIDLLKLQADCGVYLKTGRSANNLEFWIGSEELTENLLLALRAGRGASTPLSDRGEVLETGEWIDAQEVLQMLHISVRTLQTLRSNGTLSFSRIGNKLYYRRGDVLGSLAGNYGGNSE